MESDNNTTLSRYWMDKAKRSIAAAENELHKGNKDFCANRLYYAAFYAVSSALVIKGLTYKKHSAVRAAFHKEFVKKGLVPQKHGILYNKLLKDREDADYIAFTSLEEDVLSKEINDVWELIKLMEEFIRNLADK